jgi:hypothetical protein
MATMLTDHEIETLAQDFVATGFPKDCEILYSEPRTDPDGIYFIANRRTDNPKGLYIGSGGFFVLRSTGEIWEFGSGQIWHEGLDYWLNWYAEGWRPGLYRFRIHHVDELDRLTLANAIVQAGATYLFREVAHGVVWVSNIRYDTPLILSRLQVLPCTFLLPADQVRAVVLALGTPRIAEVEYSLIGSIPRPDWRPENNRPEQLGAQYE